MNFLAFFFCFFSKKENQFMQFFSTLPRFFSLVRVLKIFFNFFIKFFLFFYTHSRYSCHLLWQLKLIFQKDQQPSSENDNVHSIRFYVFFFLFPLFFLCVSCFFAADDAFYKIEFVIFLINSLDFQ